MEALVTPLGPLNSKFNHILVIYDSPNNSTSIFTSPLATTMSFLNMFKKSLPWVQPPLIANAPMSGVALSDLAIAVSRAGGLGQIGFLDDMRELSKELDTARDKLQDFMATFPDPQVLPIGVGVIVFESPLEAWMRLFKTHKPAVAWL